MPRRQPGGAGFDIVCRQVDIRFINYQQAAGGGGGVRQNPQIRPASQRPCGVVGVADESQRRTLGGNDAGGGGNVPSKAGGAADSLQGDYPPAGDADGAIVFAIGGGQQQGGVGGGVADPAVAAADGGPRQQMDDFVEPLPTMTFSAATPSLR